MIEVAFLTYGIVSLFVIYGLLVTIDRDRKAMYKERSELLNRIKPETAILSNLEVPEMVEHVRTDEEYWQAHEKQIKDEGTYPYGYEEEAKGR